MSFAAPARAGAITKGQIVSGWPHQVALPERLSCREHWTPQYEFCKGLSLCPRGHAFVRDGEWWTVKCFATREDADRFMARFGGEYITPRMR